MKRRMIATAPGKCDCCATAYEPGARLHQEGRWWVLDEHPTRPIAPRKRKWEK